MVLPGATRRSLLRLAGPATEREADNACDGDEHNDAEWS